MANSLGIVSWFCFPILSDVSTKQCSAQQYSRDNKEVGSRPNIANAVPWFNKRLPVDPGGSGGGGKLMTQQKKVKNIVIGYH